MTPAPTSPWTLTARWIFPVDGPPLEHGTLTIAGDKIVAVEPRGTRTPDRDLGNTAILPGFVNAHTHLDLSGMRGKCPPTPDFTAWLRGVIRFRRGQSAEEVQSDIQTGIAETIQTGTTFVGDIAVEGSSWDGLARSALRSIVFYEMIGLSEQRGTQVASAAWTWRNDHPPTPICRPGVSPHAPYSVSLDLFSTASLGALRWQQPCAVHLAETAAEFDLLQDHSGPFENFLQDLGIWLPDRLAPSHDTIVELLDCYRERFETPLLWIHANYLAPSERLRRNHSIVYCPRTHAAFGHAPHPFRDFLARGVRVALGTDSLASNPDLSILNEARFVHQRYPDVPGATLLRMATLSGAEALGWADETGSLTPGKSADFVVLPLPDDEWADPHELLWQSELGVQKAYFRGERTVGGP